MIDGVFFLSVGNFAALIFPSHLILPIIWELVKSDPLPASWLPSHHHPQAASSGGILTCSLSLITSLTAAAHGHSRPLLSRHGHRQAQEFSCYETANCTGGHSFNGNLSSWRDVHLAPVNMQDTILSLCRILLWGFPSHYAKVSSCEVWKTPWKGREIMPSSCFLSRYNMTWAVESNVNPNKQTQNKH